MVEEGKEKYKKTHQRGITFGAILLITGIIPLLAGGMFEVSNTNIILLTTLFLAISNFGIHILIRVLMKVRIYDMLLNT